MHEIKWALVHKLARDFNEDTGFMQPQLGIKSSPVASKTYKNWFEIEYLDSNFLGRALEFVDLENNGLNSAKWIKYPQIPLILVKNKYKMCISCLVGKRKSSLAVH